MTRIMKERWDANKDKLRDALAERPTRWFYGYLQRAYL